MSLNIVMERLKVESVKAANALNPTRKGAYIIIPANETTSKLHADFISCLISGDDKSAFAFISAIAKKHGKKYAYWVLFDLCFTHANSFHLHPLVKVAYLCAEEQNRRPVKSFEVCVMYCIDILCNIISDGEAIEKYKFIAESAEQDIKHARDTYWNHSHTKLMGLALSKHLPIPQRVIALRYIYGVEIDEVLGDTYTKEFKPYPGSPDLWFDISLELADGNPYLQILLQLGYMYYRKSPMMGLSLLLKKAVDNNG